jgi:hypothetical protein
MAGSLARRRVQIQRDGTSTQAERRPDWRGMQAAKFGREISIAMPVKAVSN